MGGGEDDPVTRVTGQISSLGEKVTDLRDALVHVLGNQAEAPTADEQGSEDSNAAERSHALAQTALTRLDAIIETLAKPQLDVHVHHQETAAIAELLERQSTLLGEALRPLVVKAGENIQHGQAVVTRLAELVAEHYEYEKTRRVRLSGPTRRLKPDE
jgi:hypothetical protein